jgi:hypothetical protein
MANDILLTTESLKHILPVYENNILEKAKYEQPKTLEPLDDDIPVVFITGNVPERKEYVTGEIEYVSKTKTFHAYTCIKLQGHGSLQYPKKNFTFVMFSDEERSIPFNTEFKQWGKHNNYVLKADYIDITHARNVVCSKLWGDIVRSRPDFDQLPEELKNSPNCGAVDGFLVKVFINGHYEGIYSLNIPKCDWQFGLDVNNPSHALLNAEYNDYGIDERMHNPCNFNSIWDGNSEYWSIEVGSDKEAIESLLNHIIIGVIDYIVEWFENGVDVTSAIDYMIFQDVIAGSDGYANNMLLVTYDMQKWYFSAYDLDQTFDMGVVEFDDGGYPLVSGLVCNPFVLMPEDSVNKGSWLQARLYNWYQHEIALRYRELRSTVLSNQSIIGAFEKFLRAADEDVRIKDTAVYPDIPCATTNTVEYLYDYINKRLAFLDGKYEEVLNNG